MAGLRTCISVLAVFEIVQRDWLSRMSSVHQCEHRKSRVIGSNWGQLSGTSDLRARSHGGS